MAEHRSSKRNAARSIAVDDAKLTTLAMSARRLMKRGDGGRLDLVASA